MHRLLGSQLREAIIRRDLDPALLSAIEWALDRHHARAAQSLSLGLGNEDLGDHLESLVTGIPPESCQEDGTPEAVPPPEVLARLIKILRAIAPEHLPPRSNNFCQPASNGDQDD